jgi:hypothetical protein
MLRIIFTWVSINSREESTIEERREEQTERKTQETQIVKTERDRVAMVMAAAEESFVERGLFGGAITCCIPANFSDVSNIREVPNNQEAFVDPNRDESIIMELLEFKTDVVDERSSLWFLQDLAIEQGSEQTLQVVGQENGITTADVPNLEASIPVNVTVGTLVSASHSQLFAHSSPKILFPC